LGVQERRGDGMRVLGVFENRAGSCVFEKTNCHYSGDRHTHRERGIVGYRK